MNPLRLTIGEKVLIVPVNPPMEVTPIFCIRRLPPALDDLKAIPPPPINVIPSIADLAYNISPKAFPATPAEVNPFRTPVFEIVYVVPKAPPAMTSIPVPPWNSTPAAAAITEVLTNSLTACVEGTVYRSYPS